MNIVVLGLQWGDEGKGKAIDYLAGNFDVIVRYQGGHNAGHTVYHGDRKVILHLLPSGIFSPSTVSVIASSVVINPIHLVGEIDGILALGVGLDKLVVSELAPLILPFHQQLDIVFEESRYLKIGTTKRGIGPAYEDLAGRRAVFMRDLVDENDFYHQVKPLSEYYNKIIQAYGGAPVLIESYMDDYLAAGRLLKPYVRNTTYLLNRFHEERKSFLFEGAQGALLDISLGTYPFVTSSHPTVGGVLIGTGLSHKAIGKVIGISKAYATRVGEGPFPTELKDATGDRLREKGDEYGSTTGRPRRVGWLDMVALKYALMVNGVDSIFLTKLDVLDDLDEIRVAVAYELDGVQTEIFESHHNRLLKARPVYRAFPGWKKPTSGSKRERDLPKETRDYLRFIEESTRVPIEYISIGSGRDQTIHRGA
jgi:adenylosuccinate synthase